MQRLTDNRGVGETLTALRHLTIRLTSRDQTRPLATEITAARDALNAANGAWEEARAQRVAATAEIEYRDELLDAAAMQLSRTALALVEGDTTDPRYRTLFPIAPSTAMRPVADDAQTRFVTALLARLEADEAFVDLAIHAPTIRQRAEAVANAINGREALYVAEATASTARAITADAARRAYNLMYPRLQLMFPGDERLVESFFVRRGRGGEGDEPVE